MVVADGFVGVFVVGVDDNVVVNVDDFVGAVVFFVVVGVLVVVVDGSYFIVVFHFFKNYVFKVFYVLFQSSSSWKENADEKKHLKNEDKYEMFEKHFF